MKIIVLCIAGTILALTSSCKMLQSEDIHSSPTAIIRAVLQGYKENDRALVLESFAPELRETMSNSLSEYPYNDFNNALLKKTWGIELNELDLQKISNKIISQKDYKSSYYNILYDKMSGPFKAIVIEIDGKWYVEDVY